MASWIRHSALASRLQLTDPSYPSRAGGRCMPHTVPTWSVAVNPYTPHQFDATVYGHQTPPTRDDLEPTDPGKDRSTDSLPAGSRGGGAAGQGTGIACSVVDLAPVLRCGRYPDGSSPSVPASPRLASVVDDDLGRTGTLLNERESEVAAGEAILAAREQEMAAREKAIATREQRLVTKTDRTPATSLIASTPKPRRNEPCSCGSGKKFKYCHGRT